MTEFLLATQNVDGLHGLAGSRRMVELHGMAAALPGLRRRARGAARADRPAAALHHLFGPGVPHVVWFGEDLPAGALDQAFTAARAADVVLVVGTSSLVYPAAAVPEAAVSAGVFVVEINPERTPLSEACALSLRGRAAEGAAADRGRCGMTEGPSESPAPAASAICLPKSARASASHGGAQRPSRTGSCWP